MFYFRIALLMSIFLQGCSSSMFHSDHYPSRFSQYGYGYEPKTNPLDVQPDKQKSFKILKKYSDRIAIELSKQVVLTDITQLSVASFVELDDNLKSSNALGNKLAENLIMSLAEIGFSMTELNFSGYIDSNERGSFVFNRTNQDQDLPLFVVSGIINYTENGVNINSRLIEMDTAKILAVNSTFLPNFVLIKEFPMVEGSDLLIKNM